MPVTVEWDDAAHTIVRYTFAGDWEWEDFLALREQVDVMLDSVEQPVGVILHIPDLKALPPNIYSRVGELELTRHPMLRQHREGLGCARGGAHRHSIHPQTA